MSRTSNRGPRADIALLRKLKADPNFSPSSLLNSGQNILDKANKLKGFVENQRGKLGAAAAKTEWLLAYQQLQGEQDDAERELTSCLQQLVDQASADQLRDVAEVALVSLYDAAEACRAERQHLRSQVKGLSSVHASLNAYGGPSEFSREAKALKSEMSATAQELESTLAGLAQEVAVLTAELKESWPSALTVQSPAAEGGLAAVAIDGASLPSVGDSVSQLPTYSRSEDSEELERMLARYPLASPDIKDRVREVFLALQDKFMERLETWRLECDQAARNLAAGAASSASSSSSSSSSRHRLLPQVTNASGSRPGPAPSPVSSSRALSGRGRAGPGRVQRSTPDATAAAAAAAAAGPGGSGDLARLAAGPGRAGLSRIPKAATGNSGPADRGPHGPGAGHVAGEGVAAATAGTADDEDVTDSVTGGADSRGEGAVTLAAGAATGTGGVGGCGGGYGGWAFAGYGGWSADEHSAFLRHRDRLMRECGQGPKSANREAIMARIATMLPGGRTAAQLMAHDDWTTAARLVSRKRRDLAEAWDRERRQFLEDSASFLQESETLFLVQAEEAADRLLAELQRVRARDELEGLRAEKAREEEVDQADRAVREAAEAEARLLAEARERRQRAAKMEMVAAYRAELEQLQAQQQAAAAEAERQAAREAEQQAVYNRGRVEVRQAEYQARQEKAKERQEALEAEALAREARLARLRALVAPEVEADPNRVLAPTAASAAADPEKGAEGAFHPVNGYTTDQVVKDQRFKVFEALAVLGLHETAYGRQAIAAAKPAMPTRPDNFTSEQREAMGR